VVVKIFLICLCIILRKELTLKLCCFLDYGVLFFLLINACFLDYGVFLSPLPYEFALCRRLSDCFLRLFDDY
jgi:hypothetical protein